MKKIFLVPSLVLLLAACSTETEIDQKESGLQTYQSSAYGFEFQFSDEWILDSTSFENQIVSLVLEKSAYEGTNVSSASFIVGVQPEESLEACLSEDINAAMAEPFSTDHFEIVNGLTYYITSGGEGSAGPDYSARFKRAYREGQCFEIVEGMFSQNIGFYGSDTTDAVDDVWARLDSIFQSFSFES
ncbi:MAG: hypothetical protein WC924_03695 [Candidatus Gracilibacteria bacterium]